MYYFYQAGYSVYLLEMIGHGYSTREVKNRCMVHVGDFADYVADFQEFLDQVVIPSTNHLRLILFGHSMGGCIASLFLEQHPEYFAKAILSSPMLAMRWNDTNPKVVSLLFFLSKMLGWSRHYMPGQGNFSKVNPYPNCSAQSKARYDYQFRLRIAHMEYRTTGGDYAWGRAATRAMRQAIEDAGRIRVPVLLFQAGEDALVAADGQNEFLQRNPSIQCKVYPKARHEIFNAFDEDRLAYYRDVFRFMDDVDNE